MSTDTIMFKKRLTEQIRLWYIQSGTWADEYQKLVVEIWKQSCAESDHSTVS